MVDGFVGRVSVRIITATTTSFGLKVDFNFEHCLLLLYTTLPLNRYLTSNPRLSAPW